MGEYIKRKIQYLCSIQNEDGGWSYNQQSDSELLLSARVGYAIQEYGNKTAIQSVGIEELLKQTDALLLGKWKSGLTQQNFQECGYLYLYSCIRELSDDSIQLEDEILPLQGEDGSFFWSISDTVLAIRLLDCMTEKHKLVMDVAGMDTELSTYVVNVGEDTDLTLKADVVTGKDYEAKLSWNDISNEENLYGYHVLRRTDGGVWESRSSWDGEEKVKVDSVYSDIYLGRLLDLAGKMYFAQVDIAGTMVAELNQVEQTRSLSVGMTGYNVQTSYLFGVSVGIKEGSLYVDIDLDAHASVSLTGDKDSEITYAFTAGILSSSYESIIWEQLTDYNGVSTISVLEEAGIQGITILEITKDNYEALSDVLDVSETVKDDVHSAVQSGKVVMIPQTTVTMENWSGSGCVAYCVPGYGDHDIS